MTTVDPQSPRPPRLAVVDVIVALMLSLIHI